MPLDKKSIRKKYKSIDLFFEKEKGKHRCACGCKEVIELKKSHFWNGIPRYIFGHAARLRAGGPSYDKSMYYSVKDIAERGGASEQTVRLWTRSGKLKPSKIIGRKNLFLTEQVDAFLKDHPRRVPFNPDDFVSVRELKKMGVARSKLRALVRAGQVANPRIYARKTHYLRADIDAHLAEIMEDHKPGRRRGRASEAAVRDLRDRLESLLQRIAAIESALNISPKAADKPEQPRPKAAKPRERRKARK